MSAWILGMTAALGRLAAGVMIFAFAFLAATWPLLLAELGVLPL